MRWNEFPYAKGIETTRLPWLRLTVRTGWNEFPYAKGIETG